jgi:hypothetical protein
MRPGPGDLICRCLAGPYAWRIARTAVTLPCSLLGLRADCARCRRWYWIVIAVLQLPEITLALARHRRLAHTPVRPSSGPSNPLPCQPQLVRPSQTRSPGAPGECYHLVPFPLRAVGSQSHGDAACIWRLYLNYWPESAIISRRSPDSVECQLARLHPQPHLSRLGHLG